MSIPAAPDRSENGRSFTMFRNFIDDDYWRMKRCRLYFLVLRTRLRRSCDLTAEIHSIYWLNDMERNIRMKNCKFRVFLIVVSMIWFGLSLCSAQGIQKTSKLENDPMVRFLKVYDAFAQEKELHVTTDVSAEVQFQAKKLNLSITNEMDAQASPLRAKSVTRMAMVADAQTTEWQAVQYVHEDGPDFAVYSYVDNRWSKQLIPGNRYHDMNDYRNYFKSIKQVEILSEDKSSLLFGVTIDSGLLKENLLALAVDPKGNAVTLPDWLLDGIGDLNYQATVDKKEMRITSIQMDLSEIGQTVGANLIKKGNLPAPQADVLQALVQSMKIKAVMKFSPLNKAEQLAVPLEALASATVVPAYTPNAHDPIKLGANLELSGGSASFGQRTLQGMQFAVREANQAGGILGRQVKLVIADNASDPATAADKMVELVTQGDVLAVVGSVSSSNTIAAARVAENAQIPFITPTGTNPRVTFENGQERKYTFRACFIDPYQGKIMAAFAKEKLNAKTAAIVIDNSSGYSKTVALNFKHTFLANGGTIVAQEGYLYKDVDFGSQLEAIKAAEPDMIFIPGYYPEVGLIVKQARNLGISIPILGADGWDSSRLVEIAGSQALNQTFFSNHYSSQDPAAAAFVSKFKQQFGYEPDAFQALGYDATKILLEAIKKAQSTDPVKIQQALEATEIEGVTGKIVFDRLHNPIKPGIIIEMVDGVQTFVQRITP
jgi:branched-chain amino acid transport system substrate-binding protein